MVYEEFGFVLHGKISIYFIHGRFRTDTDRVYPLRERTTTGIMNLVIVDGQAKENNATILEDLK
jgi:hypothetical protein